VQLTSHCITWRVGCKHDNIKRTKGVLFVSRHDGFKCWQDGRNTSPCGWQDEVLHFVVVAVAVALFDAVHQAGVRSIMTGLTHKLSTAAILLWSNSTT
jgi:hypothetical protein